MDKKKFLIFNILNELIEIRPEANELIALLESRYVDEELIDYFIKLIDKNLTVIENNKSRNLFEISKQKLVSLKQQESKSKMQDEKEIDDIFDKLNTKYND